MLAWLCYLLRWLTRANILAHRATRAQPMHQYIGASGVLSVKARAKDDDLLKLGLTMY